MAPLSSAVDVTLVTHIGLPDGAPDDVILARALHRAGLSVNLVPWDAQDHCWQSSRISLVRSTWDYHVNRPKWEAWLARVSRTTQVLNAPALLRWNTDKRYLLQLIQAGVPCIPTLDVSEGWPAFGARHVADDWIVKPAVGASAKGVRRFKADDLQGAALTYAKELRSAGAVLLQPFVPEVQTAGERSLVFLAGDFSHAYIKPAFSLNATGTTPIARHVALGDELAAARRALACVPVPPLYARVDLVPTPAGPLIMEVELIEPDLGLRLDTSAADRLAELVKACAGLKRPV